MAVILEKIRSRNFRRSLKKFRCCMNHDGCYHKADQVCNNTIEEYFKDYSWYCEHHRPICHKGCYHYQLLELQFLILKRLNKSCIYLHLLRCIYRSATNNLSDLITISFFNIAHLKKLKVKRATVVSFYVNVIKMSLNAGVNILNHR